MLWRYGIGVGLRLLRHGRALDAARYLIRPVNYWRTVEYDSVWAEGDFAAGQRVLDIGSPKLFSVYLADRVGAEVYATDIDSYFLDRMGSVRELMRVPASRLHLQTEDGRDLGFDDNSFDRVYSISVIEHIPDTGDSDCLREIGRVLAPGGRCVITVPFWPTSRVEYTGDDFYWSESSTTAADGRTFFQRRYSEDDLRRRLIEPAGLKLKKLAYIGEKVLAGSQRELACYLPALTGPVQPLLSRLLHTGPVSSWRYLRKPLCALIVLEKPAI